MELRGDRVVLRPLAEADVPRLRAALQAETLLVAQSHKAASSALSA